MKKSSKKLAAFFMAAALCVVGITGCGTKNDTTGTESPVPSNSNTPVETDNGGSGTNTKLSGSITIAGSTSMEKLSTALSEAFMTINKGVIINSEYIGSSAGVESLIAGNATIGNASRALKDSETKAGVVENIVAIDGIAIVTDKANTVTSLTKDQLTKIYTGEIKNWSEVGGEKLPIVVVGREAGSGTRGAFEEILDVTDKCVYANELDSTGAVMAKAASTKGAIGYVSLDVLDDSVLALSVEEIEPTAENIKAGTYLLSRPFVMATMGEISAQSAEVIALFDYLASEDGKNLISSVGLINVD